MFGSHGHPHGHCVQARGRQLSLTHEQRVQGGVGSFPQDKEVRGDPWGNEVLGTSSDSFSIISFPRFFVLARWGCSCPLHALLIPASGPPRVPSPPCLSILDLASVFIP